MKILFTVNSLDGGGAEKVVATLCNEMVAQNHEVYLVLVKGIFKYEIDSRVKVHVLQEGTNEINKVMKPFQVLVLSKKLKKLYQEWSNDKPFDLVTSHLVMSNVITFMAGIDSYACLHNNYSGHHALKKSTELIIRAIYRNKKILSISNGVTRDFVEVLKVRPKSVELVYNPIDYDKILDLSEENDSSIPNERFILHVGRFTPQKRHDNLVRAFKEVKTDCKLVMIGEGVKFQETKELVKELGIEDRVIFAGWKPNPYPWMKKADLLVLSSDTEGLPVVILEALACGTPVVSTNFSGVDEVLIKDLSSNIVPPGQYKELAAKIDEALTKSVNVDESYVERFKLENVVNRYLALAKKK